MWHSMLSRIESSWPEAQNFTQNALNNIANGLKVKWTVRTNTKEMERFEAEVTLENGASTEILSYGPWKMYFFCIFMIEPDLLGNRGNKGAELVGQGLKVTHVQGSFFYFEPTESFIPLPPGGMRKIILKVRFWSVARTDNMLNWYMVYPGLKPVVIASTQGEDLAFVSERTSPAQWKRYDFDEYNPFTAQERYDRNYVPYPNDQSELRLVPKPLSVKMDSMDTLKYLTIDPSWYISYTGTLTDEVEYLRDYLHLSPDHVLPSGNRTGQKVISMQIGTVEIPKGARTVEDTSEAYSIESNFTTQRITLVGNGTTGVFYAVISLMAMMTEQFEVPELNIIDSPRFSYRGLLLDLARNFQSKEKILEMIELMSLYKLNKLHLHLSDDEGWRLEIKSLPELVQVGSQRCHDMEETKCLIPQLGSGPDNTTAGSGYLSANDYIEILEKARKHHVTVIPEIDMPGHSRAAIVSMKARKEKLVAMGQETLGLQTYLTEENDTSIYLTPQTFSDDAINPCLEETYTFINILMDELLSLHRQGNQPLTMFHFGGDEVGAGAWVNSTKCKTLREAGQLIGGSPKTHFFQRVSRLAATKNLSLGAWEDGLMQDGNEPYNLSTLPVKDMYAYNWDNVLEWGTVSRTYTLANNGFKVVMVHSSHFYFDHPYEPDPEERGFYWATRFTDTKKSFSYNAVRFYDNIHTRGSGQPVTDEELCGAQAVNCPPLKIPQNIVGLQANLFTEITRTKEHLHNRVFPRLLALAERAWHEAPWERLPKGTEREAMTQEDWYSFARALGHRELKRLDKLGVMYTIPPPGARLDHGLLLTTSQFPGLRVHYSYNAGATWMDASGPTVNVGDYKYQIWLRTASTDGKRHSRTIVLYPTPPLRPVLQSTVDYISKFLVVNFTVVDNYLTYGEQYYVANVQLTNNGSRTVPAGNWRIYLPSVHAVESEFLDEGHTYLDSKVKMSIDHVKGYLYSLGPTPLFQGLDSWESVNFTFRLANWCVSRSESMPRWYVSAPGMSARDMVSTVGEKLEYVSPFTKKEQWKRFAEDQFEPWTPGARYDRNMDKDMSPLPASLIIPTPVSFKSLDGSQFRLPDNPVTIVYADPSLKEVAIYLKETLTKLVPGIRLTISSNSTESDFILLRIGHVAGNNASEEIYKVMVSGKTVDITGKTIKGVFYGAISLIHLTLKTSPAGSIPHCEIIDWPRFPYRGQHVDTGRNFQSKETILKLLEVMSLYKLNKLHFHLSDDEGWRLEIPGLEELTTITSRRCHDPEERECVMSTLGSGAGVDNSGTGYYTIQDYKDILHYANARQIEVIPEFDMPGHAHAAIVAMKNRERKTADIGKLTQSKLYTLHDQHDYSIYSTNQGYTDNAINPCIESTYRFIQHIFTEVKELHRNIQPLQVFHFGGDEVAKGAWQNSTACAPFLQEGINLKREFTRRVSEITKEVNLGAWEDGLIEHDLVPWNRSLLLNNDVITQSYQNVWEWGTAALPYNLANAGYKVVLAPVTHTFFDHPQEPSPEESGFNWGTRYTDAFKTFSFMPDDYYKNIDMKRSGEPITTKEVCKDDNSGCPPLERSENIIGLQGQLWSEIVRTPEQFNYMLYPRILALAERSWHRASWEGHENIASNKDMKSDWSRFARSLGSADLVILDKLNVSYRVPPPGAIQSGDKVLSKVEFPGLKVQYRSTSESSWSELDDSKSFKNVSEVTLRTLSADGKRFSSEVKVTMVKTPAPANSKAETIMSNGCMFLSALCCTLLLCKSLL
ncbi:uncharacterized protein LOC106055747 isoform X2 [Biomphalaria glabrata]|uniref:beta-N-acetylhexosaminidase n=1 Tax=Biomphalaria glabrata TaxID=6526 RepID=A0A9W2YYT1_BIOGL|nr:uncharacterized protein LOC106055747 isoform X2 [Biomphalaria glabrata]